MIDALWRCLYRAAWLLRLAYAFVLRPRIAGAHVAVWHDAKLLVVRNSYRRSLGFPAGGVKSGETTVETAVRELAEEVGLAVEAGDLRLVGEFACECEFHRDRASVYEIVFTDEPTIEVDRREVVWAEFRRPADLGWSELNPIVRRYLEVWPSGAFSA